MKGSSEIDRGFGGFNQTAEEEHCGRPKSAVLLQAFDGENELKEDPEVACMRLYGSAAPMRVQFDAAQSLLARRREAARPQETP